jgi:ADP-ribose pyrophosphatase YjhB (NUDIX family)
VSRIRVIAIAVIARPSDGALLVFDGQDSVTRERYHRPLGGGIEVGETAEAAVRRELREEIGADLDDVRLLGFLENIFTLDGRPRHEIVAVLSARLVDESLYTRDELVMVENGHRVTARWVPRSAFRSEHNPGGPHLVPNGLAALLEGRLRA